MNVFSFLRPHNRWAELADAFADGELAPGDGARFEAHAAACEACAASLKAGRALKAAIAGLPEVQAPRSFRLTAAMVAASAPEKAPRPLRVATPMVRFAQVGAAAAVIALAAVALADFAGGSDGGNQAASGEALSEANEKGLGLEAANAEAPPQATLAVATPEPTLPPPLTQGASAAGAEQTPESGAGTARGPQPPQTGADSTFTGVADNAGSPATDIGEPEILTADDASATVQIAPGGREDSGGIPAIRFVEIALGAVAVASIGLLLWSRGKRGRA
jgi:Putative zinc-finger